MSYFHLDLKIKSTQKLESLIRLFFNQISIL